MSSNLPTRIKSFRFLSRGVWQVRLSRLIFNQEMREFKSRTPYQFNGGWLTAFVSLTHDRCHVGPIIARQHFCGDYSLAGPKRLSVQQEIESSNLSSHPRFQGALGKPGLSQLILDQSFTGSNPVRTAKLFNLRPWPRGEALGCQPSR